MKKKCVLILPYFGKLKNYFNMFLASCASNDKFDWLIISDQNCPECYENIRWIKMSFLDFRNIVQRKFDFPISLEKPYKLCDYKPAYGYILKEYIDGYEYWGHCDCDLIFGNLNKILIPILENNYDKIFAAGHLTIYKNTNLNNRRFMKRDADGIELYKIAYSHNNIFGFDEDCYKKNVHTIYQNDSCKLFEKDLSYNVSPSYYNIFKEFYDAKDHIWKKEPYKFNVLLWDGKSLNCYKKKNGIIYSEEYIYIHLQMRKMQNSVIPTKDNSVLIAPEKFELVKNISDISTFWRHQKKIYLSTKIIIKFCKNWYYKFKSHCETQKEIDPYLDYK